MEQHPLGMTFHCKLDRVCITSVCARSPHAHQSNESRKSCRKSCWSWAACPEPSPLPRLHWQPLATLRPSQLRHAACCCLAAACKHLQVPRLHLQANAGGRHRQLPVQVPNGLAATRHHLQATAWHGHEGCVRTVTAARMMPAPPRRFHFVQCWHPNYLPARPLPPPASLPPPQNTPACRPDLYSRHLRHPQNTPACRPHLYSRHLQHRDMRHVPRLQPAARHGQQEEHECRVGAAAHQHQRQAPIRQLGGGRHPVPRPAQEGGCWSSGKPKLACHVGGHKEMPGHKRAPFLSPLRPDLGCAHPAAP